MVGLLLVYPLGTFLASGHRGREPNAIDRLVIALVSPVQRALGWAIDGVLEGAGGYVALRGLREKNFELLEDNRRLRGELNSLKEAAAENDRLRRLVGYLETTAEQEIVAQVVGINPVANFLSVRINRGEGDGVRVGMPAVTPDGVVGRVIRSVGGWSDVALLDDPTSKIAVTVQRSRVRGTAVGAGGGKPLSLSNVLRSEDVQDGDLLVTLGTDGIYPKGLMVGRVGAVRRNNSGMFLSAEITPSVETRRLEEVLIVPIDRAPALAREEPQ